VRNLRNNLSVVLQITDRGPFLHGRLLDLSRGAAAALDAVSAGVIPVEVEVLEDQATHRCQD
jgi:rare lipoprotein A